MICSNNVINVLTAKTYRGIGTAWVVKNLEGNEAINTIINLLNRDAKVDYIITIDDFESNRKRIKNKIQKLEGFIDGVIAIGDDNFPLYRGSVKNSEQPVVLFYRGNLNLLNITNKNIAVIGLLEPDENIEKIEQKVVYELVKSGATIVSGLALGCDSIAHRESLNSNGKTIAILPSSLDNILPTSNKELANEIVKNDGLLITEYYDDVKSKNELSSRYQNRDRLQALFSDSIILSASYAKNNLGKDSGSRLAMGYALNYSIPRAVIYNKVTDSNNSKYDLNRQLIKEDKQTIIINQNNLPLSIQKILSNKPIVKTNTYEQRSLFD